MAEQLIDWSDISGIIIDVRRNARSSHGITRNSNHTGRSSAKRPRLDAHIDVTIGPEHFPEIDKANDGIEDPARFFIDPQHGKIFTGAITTLARFGDSIMFFPSREGLTVKAFNLTRTAASQFSFGLEFFGAIHTFDLPRDKPCVRIFTKSILPVLKRLETWKGLESFVFDIDQSAEHAVLRASLKNGISRKYKLHVAEVLANSMPKFAQRDESQSFFSISGHQLCEALAIVDREAEQIGFWGSNQDVIFHTIFQPSYTSGNWRKATARISDCININIPKKASFSFAPKDVVGLGKFANKHNAQVSLYFKAPKTPLFVVVDIPGFCETTLTLTTNPISDKETSNGIAQMFPNVVLNVLPATQPQHNASIISNSPNRRVSLQDQFKNIKIDQTHELVVQFVNEQSDPSYWMEVVSVGPFEEAIID